MPIDHIGLCVPQDSYQETLKFYTEALKPLGYEVKMQFGPFVTGMGPSQSTVDDYNQADFWLTGVPATPNTTMHIAFSAKGGLCILADTRGNIRLMMMAWIDRATVDAFHAAALRSGGEDNGEPGPRAHYHPNYYGAFVKDAFGNNIEVVCHSAA